MAYRRRGRRGKRPGYGRGKRRGKKRIRRVSVSRGGYRL